MPNYEPFVGFTFNGKHSIDDLKIYRVSTNKRYTESLIPTMTEKTADIVGGNGQYYFGTTFKNRTFSVDYVFDRLTKTEINQLKRVFSGEGIHDLVFDEDRGTSGEALKTWSAKVTGTAQIKHLCFEENGEDVYKGEGSVTFTCYFPFARSHQTHTIISTVEAIITETETTYTVQTKTKMHTDADAISQKIIIFAILLNFINN